MSASPWNLPLALMLVALGVVFAWYERRMARLLPTFSERLRPILAAQTRRRLRVATLFVMIGVLMACGHWTDPQTNPIRFLIIGLTTALFSITLLAYGMADYHAARSRRREAERRTRALRAASLTAPNPLGSAASRNESSSSPAPPSTAAD